MSWKLDCVVVGPIQCNCYILSDSISKKAYVIDPGAESIELVNYVRKKDLQLQAVLITHAHVDHIGGVHMMNSEFGATTHYHEADESLFSNIAMQAQLFGVTPTQLQAVQPAVVNAGLNHGQLFEFDHGQIQVLHTPGHTPGSVCFLTIGDESLLFSGDTLFEGSIGRTDLWGGDFTQIIASIKTHLLTLDDSVQVFPGHGEPTTIGDERRQNPFLLR